MYRLVKSQIFSKYHKLPVTSIRNFGYLSDPPVLVTRNSAKVQHLQKLVDDNWNVTHDHLFEQNAINQVPPKAYSLEEYNKIKSQLWSYDSELPPFDIDTYFQKLKVTDHGTSIIYAPVLTSTQGILNSRFSFVDEGLVCVTCKQTSGIGRGNNVWDSPYGCLAFSYKSKLSNPSYLPQMQYLVSLSVIKTVKQYPKCQDIDIKIKWPNDIYANGKKKICGILCQSSYSKRTYDITTGIGLNISNSKPTTCIMDLIKEKYPDSNVVITFEDFLANYFSNFSYMFGIFKEIGFKTFIKSYTDNWLHNDQDVQILRDGDEIDVKIKGLTDDGFLLAVDKNGTQHELLPDGNRFDYFKGLISQKIIT